MQSYKQVLSVVVRVVWCRRVKTNTVTWVRTSGWVSGCVDGYMHGWKGDMVEENASVMSARKFTEMCSETLLGLIPIFPAPPIPEMPKLFNMNLFCYPQILPGPLWAS